MADASSQTKNASNVVGFRQQRSKSPPKQILRTGSWWGLAAMTSKIPSNSCRHTQACACCHGPQEALPTTGHYNSPRLAMQLSLCRAVQHSSIPLPDRKLQTFFTSLPDRNILETLMVGCMHKFQLMICKDTKSFQTVVEWTPQPSWLLVHISNDDLKCVTIPEGVQID